jgi:hypothetical protein
MKTASGKEDALERPEEIRVKLGFKRLSFYLSGVNISSRPLQVFIPLSTLCIRHTTLYIVS